MRRQPDEQATTAADLALAEAVHSGAHALHGWLGEGGRGHPAEMAVVARIGDDHCLVVHLDQDGHHGAQEDAVVLLAAAREAVTRSGRGPHAADAEEGVERLAASMIEVAADGMAAMGLEPREAGAVVVLVHSLGGAAPPGRRNLSASLSIGGMRPETAAQVLEHVLSESIPLLLQHEAEAAREVPS